MRGREREVGGLICRGGGERGTRRREDTKGERREGGSGRWEAGQRVEAWGVVWD